MDLFGRYIFRQALGAFLLIMLSLTGIVWIATALKQLTTLTSQGQEALTFFKMTLLALPNLMVMIGPVALLVASLHTFNRLNGDSELIVMTASGATVWRFLTPLLVLAGIVSLLVLLANLYVLPWSVRTLQDYIAQLRASLISQVIQPGEFSSPESGLTFHIRDRAPDGTLLGLMMQDNRDRKQSITYLAEEGHIIDQGAQQYLMMRSGQILRNDPKADGTSIIVFDSYVIDLAQIGPKVGTPELKPRARYVGELLWPDPEDALFKAQPGQFRSELHERLSSPLYPIAFVIIVVAYLGQARTNRQGRTRSLVTAFVLAALLRLLGMAAMNLVTLKAGAVPLVYAVPIAAGLGGLGLAWLQMQPRRASRLAGIIEEAADRSLALLARLRAGRSPVMAQPRQGGAR